MNSISIADSADLSRLVHFSKRNLSLEHKTKSPKNMDQSENPKKKNRRRIRKSKYRVTEETPAGSSEGPTSSDVTASSSKTILSPKSFPKKHMAGARQYLNANAIGRPITKGKLNEDDATAESELTFNLRSLKSPKQSHAFRKKSKKYKYINLKSFGKYGSNILFETDIDRLAKKFLEMSIEPMFLRQAAKEPRRNKAIQTNHTLNESTSTEHNELFIKKINRDERGHETIESTLIVQDSSVQVDSKNISKSAVKRRQKKELRKLEKKSEKQSDDTFSPLLTKEEAELGEKAGLLVRGFIRVNPKNFRNAYVSNEDTTSIDYLITSVGDRNRALDGDEVLLRIKPSEQWQDGQKTAVVVYIIEKVHSRITVGILKPYTSDCALFWPRDQRVPVMRIPSVNCPERFKTHPKSFENNLFVAKLIDWPEPNKAIGFITDSLGVMGDLRVETMAILKENDLDITPFSAEMTENLPKSKEIPAKELEYREDIRGECIFTIDPLTARDLDDAVSVKELPNGHYEIGVHISDASYYLHEGTPLDKKVGAKGTTIYLVDSVYHMLPVELCLHCSLLPGEDKLAFSVFWEMDEKGEIFSTRFARTVLNSCSQLAYEHAQQMIEDPNKEFKPEELPRIFNGFTAKDLSKTVNILQKIAVILRNGRIENGSLRIDQIKLLFSLNPSTGEPEDFIVYKNKEAHRLIEEFMLLANISVARKIADTFPDIAFLRCHEPPKFTMLQEAQKSLESCGIHIDISSSGSIQTSLNKYISDDFHGMCRGLVLNHILAKSMTRARYFCAGSMESDENYSHYALSVPIYTHFTSPIRRYADIMVHRLLAASLDYVPKPNWDLDYAIKIAANCNKQKYNAKKAGEMSSDLYLAHYVEKNQPHIRECVVIDVKDKSFDAIVRQTGSVIRVYQNKCNGNPRWKVEEIPSSSPYKSDRSKIIFRLVLDYPPARGQDVGERVIVTMFSVVQVELKRLPKSSKLEAILVPPVKSVVFAKKEANL